MEWDWVDRYSLGCSASCSNPDHSEDAISSWPLLNHNRYSRNYFPPNNFFFKIMYIWNKLSTAPSTTTKGRVIQSDNPFCHKISRLQLLLSESRWLAPSSLELSNSFCYTTFQFNYLQDMTCFTFSQMLNFNFNSNLILIGANLTVTYQHFWWWKF